MDSKTVEPDSLIFGREGGSKIVGRDSLGLVEEADSITVGLESFDLVDGCSKITEVIHKSRHKTTNLMYMKSELTSM